MRRSRTSSRRGHGRWARQWCSTRGWSSPRRCRISATKKYGVFVQKVRRNLNGVLRLASFSYPPTVPQHDRGGAGDCGPPRVPCRWRVLDSGADVYPAVIKCRMYRFKAVHNLRSRRGGRAHIDALCDRPHDRQPIVEPVRVGQLGLVALVGDQLVRILTRHVQAYTMSGGNY